MKWKHLTINTATRTCDQQIFALRKSAVKGQRSKVKGPRSGGFTLVEMIVSLGLFTIVLFISTSAFLSVLNADRKSRVTRIATDNLNLALEDMSRKIKTGSAYNCGAGGDCAAGVGNTITFLGQNGVSFIYKRGIGPGALVSGIGASGCGSALYTATQGCLLREDVGLVIPMIATSPEIDITNLSFAVLGSAVFPDRVQPVVVIKIDGALGVNSLNQANKSAFSIQTAVTQRAYDY